MLTSVSHPSSPFVQDLEFLLERYALFLEAAAILKTQDPSYRFGVVDTGHFEYVEDEELKAALAKLPKGWGLKDQKAGLDDQFRFDKSFGLPQLRLFRGMDLPSRHIAKSDVDLDEVSDPYELAAAMKVAFADEGCAPVASQADLDQLTASSNVTLLFHLSKWGTTMSEFTKSRAFLGLGPCFPGLKFGCVSNDALGTALGMTPDSIAVYAKPKHSGYYKDTDTATFYSLEDASDIAGRVRANPSDFTILHNDYRRLMDYAASGREPYVFYSKSAAIPNYDAVNKRVFEGPFTQQILFGYQAGAETTVLETLATHVARTVSSRDAIHMLFSNEVKPLEQTFGLTAEDYPCVVMYEDVPGVGLKTFMHKGEMTADKVTEFVRAVIAGTAPRHHKSAKPVDDSAESMKVVSRDEWASRVLHAKRPVIVNACVQDNDLCRAFKYEYFDRLSKELAVEVSVL
jgi:hypothetical protein